MNDWRAEVNDAIDDFVRVAGLAHAALTRDGMTVEFREAPHTAPKEIPKGTMAIYGFWFDGEWLKIGMAGPKSQARYTSQHYNEGSAPSTLASSLIKDASVWEKHGFSPLAAGYWIKQRTHRVNILIGSSHGKALLALLEAFLHARLEPRYEK